MAGFERGLYEVLITKAMEAGLAELGERLEPKKGKLHAADAPDRIALHVGRVVQRVLAAVDDKERVRASLALARVLLEQIDKELPPKREESSAMEAAPVLGDDAKAVLRAVLERLPTGEAEEVVEPLIPLLDTTLLTNAPGEPRVGSQVLAEIHSADRVDVVMAFIRHSGIAPLLDALRRHCASGRPLRILTTTYTGSTEARALGELDKLGADIRVSYDTTSTRLHAKAWLFHRRTGFSTAYVGSSNLTHSAQVSGLEWNVRVSGARNPDVVDKVAAVFESYWNSGDFVPYQEEEFRTRTESRDTGPEILLSPIELRPEPFQERLLEQIALSRQQGHHRNLLVAATGTGKTVMAAVDYTRLREKMPRARLLFVAHREEILTQSLATFRYALRDESFGEPWVGGKKPAHFEHVFASIQSLSATGLDSLDPAHFDVVIVDEFHHAAADSYRTLLDHVRPRELLGLTATPERSDGLSILGHFDGRIAAELRLWDAIDQHRLVPFAYFGIPDHVDLRNVDWRRGQGYDVEQVTGLLTNDERHAKLALAELARRVDDVRQVRALGFCVSVAHARHMARVFQEAAVPSVAIWGDSPAEARRQALRDLRDRKVNVVFSVDLFNEGVDVPSVDTLMLLRPTDSPTLFLQQLGRGLRKSAGKTACTVLDFVGEHRKQFRYERRFRALLGGSRGDLEAALHEGFPYLPAGCHMELVGIAKERVLRNLKEAIPTEWRKKVEELRDLRRGGEVIELAQYLDETGRELEDVYGDGGGAAPRCWSTLCAEAGLPVAAEGREERALRSACGRLLHVDDEERLDAYAGFVALEAPPELAALSERRRRLLRMLVASLLDKAITKESDLGGACRLLWEHPQVLSELRELFGVLRGRIEHVAQGLDTHADVPLQVHARYSRIEILAAFDEGGEGAKVAAWQAGVYWAKEAKADLLAFTLDKTSGGFSPTTRYRDYAISRDRIHWESQSKVRAESETGRRYREHERRRSHVMLFARLRADDRALWFLGPATYVSHEGELPMAITWSLKHALPGDLFAAFAAAVA